MDYAINYEKYGIKNNTIPESYEKYLGEKMKFPMVYHRKKHIKL